MLETLFPLLAVVLVALAIPTSWRQRRGMQLALVAGLAFLLGRYIGWRFIYTVLPAQDLSFQSAFVWFLFVIELLIWLDAIVLYMGLVRRTDRSAEADAHEARLRTTHPADLPVVDVLITTINEPLEVVEKTILGALAIDWPADKLRVHVLDDGRRDWLRDHCAEKGAGYMTREGNAGAKAGNINAALARVSGDYFLVLDADFVPLPNILYRTAGFFADPKIGIVQVPHHFVNGDPMQTNLAMEHMLPGDQRLFFDMIMPGRDGWNAAFCCGSNALTRRAVVMEIGGLPTGSVTEDMLLTLALLRKGYVTRYLNERLAIGLAPESLSAFFVQRARWARGAMQILHLKDGPLGPGLNLSHRLMFLPLHWLTQTLGYLAGVATPAIYLWTGTLPLLNATTSTVLSYQVPTILASLLVLRIFAPGQFVPLASAAHGVLQAIRLLPVVLTTLVRPHGHAFRVTPKGRDATAGSTPDGRIVAISLGLVVVTALGLVVNAGFNSAIVPNTHLIPVVAVWAVLNMIVLLVVATIAASSSSVSAETVMNIDEPCAVETEQGVVAARLCQISLEGARLKVEITDTQREGWRAGQWHIVDVEYVGRIPAEVSALSREHDGITNLDVRFYLPHSRTRDILIRRVFAIGLDTKFQTHSAIGVMMTMLLRTLRRDLPRKRAVSSSATRPPRWIDAALS